MRQIIAIGGGGFTRFASQFLMEKYLLQQTGKDKPKVCFLPQASNENADYVVKFFSTFTALGAVPSWFSLFGRVQAGWQQQLLAQDLIYVGGGNTKSMLALWRAWGVDQVLAQAYSQGVVLAGVSAGAICWFEQGITDSVWPLGVIPGLGLLAGSCCPHFDSEPEREPMYRQQVQTGQALPGLALQDETMAHFVDDQLQQIIKTDANKKAFRLLPEHTLELDSRLIS
jgi:dipeptidase E